MHLADQGMEQEARTKPKADSSGDGWRSRWGQDWETLMLMLTGLRFGQS